MTNICDVGENLDVEPEPQPEITGKHVNPHPYGTPEWQKVEEQKIKDDSAKRMEKMQNLHNSMDEIWKENYLERQKLIDDFIPMSKTGEKKPSCAPPKFDKFPLNKYCEVTKYKQCVTKLTNEVYEVKEENNS